MDTPIPGGPTPIAGAPGTVPARMVAQYVKDLSFENPQAPNFLALPQGQQPSLNIQINVNARPISETDYEVELAIEGRAEHANSVIFAVELKYGGVLRLQGVPQENIHPVVLIEGPRLLFPFARQIVADTVRDGGFPPLMLDPVDFAALYRQRVAEQASPPATKQTN